MKKYNTTARPEPVEGWRSQKLIERRRTKKYFALLSFLSILTAQLTAHACPTCIGRIQKKSPPFFSNEYYKPGQNNKRSKQIQKQKAVYNKTKTTTKGESS